MCAQQTKARHAKGRPSGPLIPCGWCGQAMTTSQLRSHIANCAERPILPMPAKFISAAEESRLQALSENRNPVSQMDNEPGEDGLTCRDEGEL